jgi:hypothetical protein
MLQVVHGHRVSGEVQHRVEQGGGVTVGENESVAVAPCWRVRVEPHVFAEEQMGNGSAAHGRARVAGLALLHGIGGHHADGVDAAPREALLEPVVAVVGSVQAG